MQIQVHPILGIAACVCVCRGCGAEIRMIKELVMKWPVMRQIFEGGDGTGREAMSDATKNLRPKNEGAQVARSVCPYCAVGCGQQIFHKDGKLISIEGDP